MRLWPIVQWLLAFIRPTVTALAAAARVGEADGGSGTLLNAGFIRIYDAVQGDPDSAATGVLLAELTFGTPAFAAATDDGTRARAVANPITGDSSADATGVAAGYRVFLSNGTTSHHTGTVSGTGGGGDMELNHTSITAGGTVDITTFNYDRPQS